MAGAVTPAAPQRAQHLRLCDEEPTFEMRENRPDALRGQKGIERRKRGARFQNPQPYRRDMRRAMHAHREYLVPLHAGRDEPLGNEVRPFIQFRVTPTVRGATHRQRCRRGGGPVFEAADKRNRVR